MQSISKLAKFNIIMYLISHLPISKQLSIVAILNYNL